MTPVERKTEGEGAEEEGGEEEYVVAIEESGARGSEWLSGGVSVNHALFHDSCGGSLRMGPMIATKRGPRIPQRG
jgi:hypothetical protein